MYEIIDKEIFNKSFNYLKNNRHIAFVVVDNEVGLCIKDIVIRLQSYLLCYFKSITIIMSGSVNQYRNIDTKCTYVETIIISEDEVDILCRLQRTFFLFSNVFFAHSTGFDGDGVSNCVLYLNETLNSMGFDSAIFSKSGTFQSDNKKSINNVAAFKDIGINKDDVVFFIIQAQQIVF